MSTARDSINRANNLWVDGGLTSALDLLLEILPDAAGEDLTLALLILGDVMVDLERPGEAEDYYRRAIERADTESRSGHSRLELLLSELGRAEEAEQLYRRGAASEDPEVSGQATLLLAILKDDAGLLVEAIALYDQVLCKTKDEDLRAHAVFNCAHALGVSGGSERSRELYRESVRLDVDPYASAAAYNLGSDLWTEGSLSEAERFLRRAIRGKTEHSPKAACHLGQLLHQQGRLRAAECAFKFSSGCGHPRHWRPGDELDWQP